VWALHALAHVLEMEARASEGASLLGDSDAEGEWGDASLYASHMAWHLGLFLLERGSYARALRNYDWHLRRVSPSPPPLPHEAEAAAAVAAVEDRVGPETESTGERAARKPAAPAPPSPPPPPTPFPLTDSSSMLWRMELAGMEVGAGRWEAVGRWWTLYDRLHLSAFNDLHAMMCYAALAARETKEAEADAGAGGGGEVAREGSPFAAGSGGRGEAGGWEKKGVWRARAEDLLASMRAYVERRGVPSVPPSSSQSLLPDAAAAAAAAAEAAVTIANNAAASPADNLKLPSGVLPFTSHAPGRGGASGLTGDYDGRAPPDNVWVTEHIGLPLCEAFLAFRLDRGGNGHDGSGGAGDGNGGGDGSVPDEQTSGGKGRGPGVLEDLRRD
ncbi:unnamed protein product, partial [Phaeothamnion confervicola]